MASVIGEAVVGKICEMAIEMAVQKLAEEAMLVVNFRKDFIWLNQELKSVRCFLQDADQQSRHKEDVKQWLENIRDIAMRAEDIFEECAVQSMYRIDAQSCGFSCSQWIFRYRIGRQIKDIKERMGSITEKGNQLKLRHDVLSADEALPSTSQSATVNRRRSSLLPRDSHPVGIQSKVDHMLSLLENPTFPVIAVVGMGGLGKTYLLQHVYNKIKERYENSMWISVSQSYSISKLQSVIASHLNLDGQIRDGGDICRAAELIQEKLQGKRYLVVLDDVWEVSREDDLLDRLGLPTANNSLCKIVVSTRSKDVCTNLHAKIYEMQYLSDEESWSLFSFYAFREHAGHRAPPQQLEEEGRKIVRQCGNLPLAIKTIAASLANTTDLSKWESKCHQLERVVTPIGNPDPVMDILKLSYNSLPIHLKACFAYISFFPEDETIDPEYLINLWIGEGFIPAGEEQWDVAWDFLYQLAKLCLLQLWEEGSGDELTKHCKIHDLLLDLAIQISKENKCVFSVEEASTNTSDGTGWCRVLLAKKDIDDNAISESRPVCLRTLSLYLNRGITSTPTNLFTAMRGLRVLDLSWTCISTLPASVRKMKLLKVLNLRATQIKEVPKCVRHLKSLLFLVLSGDCSKLPVWISELKCLKHLECWGVDRIPKEMSKLVSLRTLRTEELHLSIEKDEWMRLEDLANMTQLQELRLGVNHEMELKRMEEGDLAQLVKMRRLVLINKISIEMSVGSEVDLPHIPENMRALKHMERLVLERFAVPTWICGLENLRELSLLQCECSDYPELQRMPNLVMLWIEGNRKCRELPKAFGEKGRFPHLRFFTIWGLDELEEFPELEEGAMACLEEFSLQACPKVKKVGEGLEQLERLKLFNYYGTSELRETFKEGGEYWNKIKSINPEVIITQ